MSSFAGHGLVGVALGIKVSWPWRIAIVFFACLPDIEYLTYWLFNIELEPRWTHSIGFVVASWAAGIVALRLVGITPPRNVSILLLLAGLSHLLMDYAVGVHANPIFAPFSVDEYASPFGVLPSAGALDPTNVYLWRNLLIELGILAPLLWLGRSALSQRATPGRLLVALAMASPFLIWSLSLNR